VLPLHLLFDRCERQIFSGCIGRISKATDSILHYDAEHGHGFPYYHTTRSASYTPQFDLEANATPEEKQQAAQHCTVKGKLNKQCAYDFYATGNGEASSVTATTSSTNTGNQTRLGVFCLSYC